MAAIREELILADRFSATFSKFIKMGRSASGTSNMAAASLENYRAVMSALGQQLTVLNTAMSAAQAQQQKMIAAGEAGGATYNKLTDTIKKLSGSIQNVSSQYATVSAQADKASAAIGRTAKSQDKHTASMNRGASAADNLGRRLLSLAGAYASLRTAQQFIGMTDTFTQTTARLDRMNDGLQTTAELQEMVYQAAQRSRGAYQETADLVSKLGTMAPEAFNSSGELVAFAEQLNKQFALAGAGTQGAQAAMLQLTQAMSAGVLRGEELNSVLEQAPTITQAIAKYMGVNIGQLREMASEGAITADVVKAALFSAAEETNAAFDSIPLTFSQAWTMAGNAANRAMEPAMKRLNGLLNSELGQNAVNGLIAGFELLGRVAAGAVDLLAAGGQWVADNWDLITTILAAVAGVAVLLAAKMALAGAVSVASALASAAAWALAHWPLLLLIGLAAAAGIAAKEMGLTFEDVFSAIGAGAGWLYVLGYNSVAAGWNLIAAFAEFFANVFDDPVAAIANLFLGLFNFIMDVVSNAAGAIDALLGTNLSGAVKSFQNGVNDFVTGIFGENKVKIERMEQISYGDTMAKWAEMGAGLGRGLDNFTIPDVLGGYAQNSIDSTNFMANSGIPGKLDQIGNDTAAIKRSVSLAEEDMKLLVDMAERQYVNNINLTAQTPVINVTGQNTGNTEMDRRSLANAIRDIIIEEAASHTDLSYR